MNFRLLNTFLAAGLSTMISSQGQAQSATDLELTIRVLGENEDPGELINQITLPAPDYFSREFSNRGSTDPDLSQSITEQVQLASEETEQTGVDLIREGVSIDGLDIASGQNPDGPLPDSDGTILPDSVVNIIDQDLPLRQSFEDELAPVLNISGANTTLDATMNTGTEAIVDVTAETLPDAAVDVSELLDSSMNTDNATQIDSVLGGSADFSGTTEFDVETVNGLDSIEEMSLTPEESISDGVEQLTDSLLNQ
jgi:hypothetical protein